MVTLGIPNRGYTMKYYKLTDSEIIRHPITWKDIRVWQLETIAPHLDLPIGTKGGYIQRESQFHGISWVYPGAMVLDCAMIHDSLIKGGLIYHNATIHGSNIRSGEISGNSVVSMCTVFGDSKISGVSRVYHSAIARSFLENATVKSSEIGDSNIKGGTVIECPHIEKAVIDGGYLINTKIINAKTNNAVLNQCEILTGSNIQGGYAQFSTVESSALTNCFISKSKVKDGVMEQSVTHESEVNKSNADSCYLENSQVTDSNTLYGGVFILSSHARGTVESSRVIFSPNSQGDQLATDVVYNDVVAPEQL